MTNAALENDAPDNNTETRRLATANSSRVSICVATNGQGRGRGRPCENFPLISLFDHNAQFSCCFSYGVHVFMRSQNFGFAGAPPFWEEDLADPLKYVPHAEVVRSRSNGTSVITQICRKNLTPHAPPFKVTRGHQNRLPMISYLIHSKHGPSLYRFRNKRHFQSKIANFPRTRCI